MSRDQGTPGWFGCRATDVLRAESAVDAVADGDFARLDRTMQAAYAAGSDATPIGQFVALLLMAERLSAWVAQAHDWPQADVLAAARQAVATVAIDSEARHQREDNNDE